MREDPYDVAARVAVFEGRAGRANDIAGRAAGRVTTGISAGSPIDAAAAAVATNSSSAISTQGDALSSAASATAQAGYVAIREWAEADKANGESLGSGGTESAVEGGGVDGGPAEGHWI
ncbi:hypothetical protein OG921_24205 [Aldersonia sp. NBC_00410]|uniref:hypothetical protein n=1 Tax=Aldersonia sp. NBC_00410 TaxID=2975954 RepID=UPI0022540F7B|nr:hypothetical protein [Aldersonia sp. NBC_00410]MCX5046279.1 hypothetical protein [Aldersonia sp. NBC_00410]